MCCRGKRVSIHAPRAGRDPVDGLRPRIRLVSIHAPRAGRDHRSQDARDHAECFNPRAPCGARQCHFTVLPVVDGVSIHAPRAGRDRSSACLSKTSLRFNPRAPCGARPGLCPCGRHHRGFNPRAPCGARHAITLLLRRGKAFQSTRPVRGATASVSAVPHWMTVSIHAPRAGRDLLRV